MGLDIYFSRMNKVANPSDERHENEEVGYFRKVNFLVQFFENNYGFSGESFDYLPVDKEMLTDLIERCNAVIVDPSKAQELLPTCSGFFFGSTDYDKYYFEDVKQVRDTCERLITEVLPNLAEGEEVCFYIWY